MYRFPIYILLIITNSPIVFADSKCSIEAISQARKLLLFHSNNDERAEVDNKAIELPPIKNPVNKNQMFTVLEVNGYIYKGSYRMRLIYYPMGNECILMGQEILELSSL
jgi:hypothetical protein